MASFDSDSRSMRFLGMEAAGLVPTDYFTSIYLAMRLLTAEDGLKFVVLLIEVVDYYYRRLCEDEAVGFRRREELDWLDI